jgi:predicted metal-dependent HD superfamily phosphohydrolase
MNLEEIKQKYSEPHRHYHNFEHIKNMFQVAEKHKVIVDEPLRHLIYMHDIVYDPTRKDNEELSGTVACEFYTKVCNDYNETSPFEDVSHDEEPFHYYPFIINMTKDHVVDFKGCITQGTLWDWLWVAKNLIDLDLAILSEAPEVYRDYVNNVRKEYWHLTDEQFLKGRIDWLCSMLGRDNIYYTEWGKSLESKAKHNLTKELSYWYSFPLGNPCGDDYKSENIYPLIPEESKISGDLVVVRCDLLTDLNIRPWVITTKVKDVVMRLKGEEAYFISALFEFLKHHDKVLTTKTLLQFFPDLKKYFKKKKGVITSLDIKYTKAVDKKTKIPKSAEIILKVEKK